jgi:hypothetical protein
MSGARLLDRIEPLGIPFFIIIFVLVPQLMPGLHIVDQIVEPPMTWMLNQYQQLITLVAGPELVEGVDGRVAGDGRQGALPQHRSHNLLVQLLADLFDAHRARAERRHAERPHAQLAGGVA